MTYNTIYTANIYICLVHSWDVVYTYKVQFSNDTLVWTPCMNGTEEAVSRHNILSFFLSFFYFLKASLSEYVANHPLAA